MCIINRPITSTLLLIKISSGDPCEIPTTKNNSDLLMKFLSQFLFSSNVNYEVPGNFKALGLVHTPHRCGAVYFTDRDSSDAIVVITVGSLLLFLAVCR